MTGSNQDLSGNSGNADAGASGPTQSMGDVSGTDGAQTMGSVPGGDQTNSLPGGDQTMGSVPSPQPSPQSTPRGGNTVALLVGGVIAVLVIVAALFGVINK